VDEILKSLDARKQNWASTSARQRAQLLGAVLRNVMQLAPKLAKAGARHKGAYEAADGEEM
jgi:acyl-CoA reductase-like NAD-dependent aldehyde dehydrogenase